MTMLLDFEGLDELIAEIDKIEQITPQLKDEALIEGGEYLKDEMKAGVYSYGLDEITGEARDAIVRTDPVNDELFVGTQGGKKQPGFYLYMHEFGYYNVRARRFIAPKPFASPIYENSKGEILNKYVEVFREGWGMS